MVVLSLPERIWTPDIVWEKDDSSSEPDSPTPTQSPKSTRPAFISMHSSFTTTGTGASSTLPPPPPISASEVADPPVTSESSTSTSIKPVKVRRKSQKYYSKDECAICMDSFHRGEVVRILPCGHVFHKDECDEWLMKWRKLVSFHYHIIATRTDEQCPTCRADVTLPPGAPLQGSTLTPIDHVDVNEGDNDEEEEEHWAAAPLRNIKESVRRLFTRSRPTGVERDEEADETTPLVPTPSTPRRSDRVV
jgi:hypothetical protein